MAKTLSIIKNGMKGGLPVQNQGLKLSKIIAIEKIEEHERFKMLYSIDEDLLGRISDDMKEHKFDTSQPVHIWLCKDEDGNEHFYLIDGYTRVSAAKLAGLTTVPYFEHNFDSFEEAHRYALHLQVDRRNLNGMDLLKNIEELMGSDYIQNMKGNKNAAIGEMLGVSEKTVERANFVEKNASEEQIEKIESGEATINSTYNELKGKKKEKSDRHVSVEDNDSESDMDSFDDISDALEDTSGDPKGIVIGDHSDHIERPTNKLTAEEDSERTRERRKAYETGYFEGFLQAANYVLSAVVADHALSSLYIDIFCNPAYHNYEQFTHMDASCYLDAEYKYSKFRKELLAERNLEDLNPAPIREFSSQNGDLPLNFANEESESEESESSGSVTDLSTFGIDFAEGE